MFDTAEFQTRCRAAGLALTHQREVIYRVLMQARDHPCPEAIYEKVRKRIPSISAGTVYKNIKTFLNAGLLREVTLHHGTMRLETNVQPHHHLVCTGCKAIFDIDSQEVDEVHLKHKPQKGFLVSGYKIEFYGLCPGCRKRQ